MSSAAARASVAIRINGAMIPVDCEIPPDALFPIYSITKTLTAICALKLFESRTLDLDATIRTYVPDVELPDSITLTHLLRHTSGLGDYGGQPAYHGGVRQRPSEPWTRQQFLDSVLPIGLVSAPGEGWAYSNVGYMLVVDAIERATGATFATNIHAHIVTPLGLRSTFALESLSDMRRCVPGFSSEVTVDKSIRDVRDVYHPGWCAPRGVASTVEETTRIYDALLNGELLQASTVDRMFTLVPLPDHVGAAPSIAAGMGVFSDTASPRGRNYTHAGGGPGYSTSVTIYPDTPQGRIAVAVFLDSSEGPQARDIEAQWLEKIRDWR